MEIKMGYIRGDNGVGCTNTKPVPQDNYRLPERHNEGGITG